MQTPAIKAQNVECENGNSSRLQRARAEKRRRLVRLAAAGLSTPFLIEGSQWSESGRKRVFDVLAASTILLLLSPFLLIIALTVALTSPGPAIFRQKRVGRHGEEFTILKFRTMHCISSGHLRSAHKDHRLTPPGRWLRKYKLDELPQLFNVVRGDMSLVGPRPKLHAHHTVDTPFRPGITGAATLAFAAEEHLLRHVHHDDLESTHARLINPRKIELDMAYMARATFRSDVVLLLRTLLRSGRYTELEQLTGSDGDALPPRTQPGSPSPVYPDLLHAPQQRPFESLSL